MVRPPCCDNPAIKKGPWTPEEDLILVSYIHQHGPCNWRSVPINTGLLRCSKSCRLRWTNYLRPGIKRGCFTPQEEGIIIHLQAMLGNRWAAISSYLPQRTDNDIKNYWNTHLKKKLKLFQEGIGSGGAAGDMGSPNSSPPGFQGGPLISKEAAILANPYSACFQSSSSTYASSAENISRLLEGWTKPSLKLETIDLPQVSSTIYANNNSSTSSITCNNQNDELIYYDHGLESLLSPEKITWPKKPSFEGETRLPVAPAEEGGSPHLTLLEKWLLDDTAGQLEGLMDRFPVNC